MQGVTDCGVELSSHFDLTISESDLNQHPSHSLVGCYNFLSAKSTMQSEQQINFMFGHVWL